MLSATFLARYALEQLFAGFCRQTLMHVIRSLQDIELARESPESEMGGVARATDETAGAASTPAAAPEADGPDDELQTAISELLLSDATLSAVGRFALDGLAPALFAKIAERFLLLQAAGSYLTNEGVDLTKVQNYFFASRAEFDAVTARVRRAPGLELKYLEIKSLDAHGRVFPRTLPIVQIELETTEIRVENEMQIGP